MKISLLVSLFILIAGGLWQLRGQRQLVVLRSEHRQLLAEADGLGISVASASVPSAAVTKRERAGGERQNIAALLDEWAPQLSKFEEAEAAGTSPDFEAQQQGAEIFKRIGALGASELMELLEALPTRSDLSEDSRKGLMMVALMALSDKDPAKAMEGIGSLEFPDPVKKHLTMQALQKLAAVDAEAALTWLDENPDQADEQAWEKVAAGMGAKDPHGAFLLVARAGEHARGLRSAIVQAATDDAARGAVLSAARHHLAGLDDPKARKEGSDQIFSALAENVAANGFEAGSAWLEEAKLSTEETQQLARELGFYEIKGECGEWIEWIAKHLPEKELSGRAHIILQQWTREDPRAAGSWLSGLEDGPAKRASVRSYAETIAPYEPEAAAQWALTLPQGEGRRNLLSAVHRQWREKDPSAAAAFAAEHGIED